MTAVAGVAGRIQAQQPVGCYSASSFNKGAPLVPAVARTQRPSQLRKMSTKIQAVASEPVLQRPDDTGRFGRFGGKYVPETLITALAELEQAYAEAMNDPAFTVSQRYRAFFKKNNSPHMSGWHGV
jgi:hypothetical protein